MSETTPSPGSDPSLNRGSDPGVPQAPRALRAQRAERYAARVAGVARQEMWGVFAAPWDGERLQVVQADAEALLLPGTDRFFADPISVAGSPNLVLAEEMDFRLGYGRLVLLSPSGQPGAEPIPLLDDGIHASYPMTYHHHDEVLLVPERCRTSRLEYYRLDPAAASVELVGVALEGRAIIDPTIHHDGSTFYLFFVDGRYGIDRQLELYVADDLLGPWTRHPEAPIANDPRWARPGGRLFRSADGRLLRPAQNCRPHYGASLALREVTELSPDRYQERPVSTIDSAVPGYRSGFHTLDLVGAERCVFDAKTYRSVLASPGLRRRTVQRARRRLWRMAKPDGGPIESEVARR